MNTLLLLRHGKSSWSDPDLPDHDRPLKRRGRRDARGMGQWIREQDLNPQLIVTSAAVRARDTAERFAEASGYAGEIRVDARLYDADVEAIQGVLVAIDEERVLLVGHNPGLEAFVQDVAGESVSLPTAGLAVIEFKGWGERGKLRGVWRPKDVRPA